jgi:dolichyl-phosphate-mannose-protein mannosyltransferase
MVGIWLFCLVLRFWKITQFNTLVFDEVYYAQFARNYLTRTTFFNAHPPLSQYIIAIGIWLGSYLPSSPENMNDLTGSLLSTFSYRWINAFIGSFLPLLIGAIAYQLSRKVSYTVIAAILAALDGLLLVESRYALNNIYLVLFGLLGHLFFLMGLRSYNLKRWSYLTLSGIFLGCCVGIKWNGLAYLVGIILLWIIVKIWTPIKDEISELSQKLQEEKLAPIHPLINIGQIKIYQLIMILIVIPLATYRIIWIPHLSMNPEYDFWEMQRQILTYHQGIGSGPEVHPYCSNWYSWPILWRPIGYFYGTVNDGQFIYDVHALGNPLLWWFSGLAILVLSLLIIQVVFTDRPIKFKHLSQLAHLLTIIYLVVNYSVNLFPWMLVTRCTFIYHYMPSLIFAILALTWILNRWFEGTNNLLKHSGVMIVLLIIVAFIFWLPIYLGLPLSVKDFDLRMIMPNWI